jgi:hypothetical protein
MEKGMREAVMAGSRVPARSVAMEGTVSPQGRVYESWAYCGHIMARLCDATVSCNLFAACVARIISTRLGIDLVKSNGISRLVLLYRSVLETTQYCTAYHHWYYRSISTPMISGHVFSVHL